MGHFLVFAFLVVFLGGCWAALSAWQQHRASGVALFRRLLLYHISFNLLVFGCFVARYAHTNLIGDAPVTYAPAIWAGSAAAVFALEICVTWSLLLLSQDLRGEPPSLVLTRAFVAAAALLGISYVIGSTVVLQNGSARWIIKTHQAMSLFMLLGVGYALLRLVVGRHPKLDAIQRRSARRFGWLLLGGFLVLAAAIALPKPIYLFGFAVGLFAMTWAPYLWLRRYSDPYRHAVTVEGASKAVAALARKHAITPREQEIMALIVEGKSNKQIQEQLFISPHTVKNHIYNLYQKLEINSRSQLLSLVMKTNDAGSGGRLSA